MPDETHNPLCGWTKLFHPRGPQVTLPLPPDPAAALAAVSAALDAGWLVQAPGLEEGEEREMIGWVLKSIHSNEDRETPFVLLYSCNEALTWSILKVYLNTPQDQAAFEHASGMKLSEMPEYVGQDKPQRGSNHRTDTYIVPAPRPFGVVFKKNPKHDQTEAGKMKPARLFVRWADTAPAKEASPDGQTAPQDDPEAKISTPQWMEIDALLKQAGCTNAKVLRLFLDWVARNQGAPCHTLADIKTSAYQSVVNDLRGRIALRAQAEAAKKANGGAP